MQSKQRFSVSPKNESKTSFQSNIFASPKCTTSGAPKPEIFGASKTVSKYYFPVPI